MKVHPWVTMSATGFSIGIRWGTQRIAKFFPWKKFTR